VIPFLGSYVAIIFLNLIGLLLFFGLDLPKGTNSTPEIAPRPTTQPPRTA